MRYRLAIALALALTLLCAHPGILRADPGGGSGVGQVLAMTQNLYVGADIFRIHVTTRTVERGRFFTASEDRSHTRGPGAELFHCVTSIQLSHCVILYQSCLTGSHRLAPLRAVAARR